MQPSALSDHSMQNGPLPGKLTALRQGALSISPLCVAVIPWGLLAGSFSVEVGFDLAQSQALSVLVFAGSAQLVATGLIHTGAGLFSILLTTLFITSRHFLYGLTLRQCISPLPLRWRLVLGFLLTDELFAICGHASPQTFHRWYALGAGLWFYVCWNLATLAGIAAGKWIPNLTSLGLDFAIAATFIAIVVPTIQSLSMVMAVLMALVLSVTLQVWHVDGALMIASLAAMLTGYSVDKALGQRISLSGDKQ